MDSSKSLSPDLICDSFLGGQVLLCQPQEGYRAGIDAVFLSACVYPRKNEFILDVGSGIGAIGILLCVREKENLPFDMIALEKERFLSEISERNASLNKVSTFFTPFCYDLKSISRDILERSFDQVITNPPFFDGTMVSPHALKARSNHPSNVSFEDWIDFCIKRLKPFGVLTLIIPPYRLSSVLKICDERVGNLRIYPLWQRAEAQAKRLLIQGIKARKSPLKLLSGLVLHNSDHTFTSEARGVLWEGKRLCLV